MKHTPQLIATALLLLLSCACAQVGNDAFLAIVGDNTIDPILKRFLMIQEMDGVFELKKVRNVRFKNVHLDIEHPEAWKCKVAERDCVGVNAQLDD